ncbi:MAG: hypothetical protein Q8903_03905 [Bacteroidota bacterium]|nr:hypothetical protein [Bacteroidota bacterium]
MRSSKLIFTLLFIFIIIFSFSDVYSQTKKQKGTDSKGSSYCKPLKKKISGMSVRFLAFGQEEFDEDSYDKDNPRKLSVRDGSFSEGAESAYFLEDKDKEIRIAWTGNSFTFSKIANQDEYGNSGILTVSGTMSDDGKMLERCAVTFQGKEGTGKRKIPEYRYKFEAHNVPSEKYASYGDVTFKIDNSEKINNIFTEYAYYKKEYIDTDLWIANKLISVDQSNVSNRFSVTFYFDNK